jgi:diaminopimelate decarboxylase
VTFSYHGDQLHCEDLSVQALAKQVLTPFYCYSAAAIRDRFADYNTHFGGNNGLVCYAVKANSNQSILRLLAALGAGADVVSEGELKRALAAGIPAERIVFSGVGKTEHEMAFALEQGILQFNVESEPELDCLNRVALSLGEKAPVAFRVNPDVDARTHRKITTGKSENKFGVPASRAREIYALAGQMDGIRIQGIDMHIGSQLTSIEPFEQAFRIMANLVQDLRADGHEIRVLDIGGGLGIAYDHQAPAPPSLSEYAAAARNILQPLGCRLLVEPGRSIVGAAGILVSEVLYLKEGQERRFLIIDAGMNDLLRPSLYDARHAIKPVHRNGSADVEYDVVGPICETGDTFAQGMRLQELKAGDLVAIMDAGAYGAVMSSFYNTHPLAPEILVDGDHFRIIRKRLEAEDIIALDSER